MSKPALYGQYTRKRGGTLSKPILAPAEDAQDCLDAITQWDAKEMTGLLDGVPVEKRPSVLRCMNARLRRIGTDETLMSSASATPKTSYLVAGLAYMVRYDVYGNRSILGSCESGDAVGRELTPFFSKGDGMFVVVKPCTVIEFSISAEVEECTCCAKYICTVRRNIIAAMSRLNNRLMIRLDILACRSAREKVLAYLRTRAFQEQSNPFTIPFNRQELADYLCLERSALSRELGRMRADCIISFSKNRFRIEPEYLSG